MDEKLKAILANIESLLEEAKQMGGGETETAETTPAEVSDGDVEKIMKILKEMGSDGRDGDDSSVKKEKETAEEAKREEEEGEVKKSDEGTHANDSAEDVVDDQGEVQDKNIAEVAKAIASYMKAKGSSSKIVRKSVTDPVSAKALADLRAENQEIRKSLETLLEGFGLAKQVTAASKVEKAQTATPAVKYVDISEVKKSILDEIKGTGSREQAVNTGWGMDVMQPSGQSVRKSMADALHSFVPSENK